MTAELYQLPARRRERRRVWSSIAFGYAAAFVLASSGATQWIAWRLGYPSWLAAPLFELYGTASLALVTVGLGSLGLGIFALVRAQFRGLWFLLASLGALVAAREPIYLPWQWLFWRAELLRQPSDLLLDQGLILGLLLALPILSRVTLSGCRTLRKLPRRGDTHGSAHYASPAEVETSGFIRDGDDGIVLGTHEGRVLRAARDEHVLVFSPPGTGKSSALAVPTLLGWQGSVVTLDAKGELYELTAGYRSSVLRQDVLRLDFADPDSSRLARFNPLLWIPRGDGEVAAAQAVAELLLSPPEGRKEDFWRDRAHEFLVALILHVLFKERRPSLAACRSFLRSRPIGEVLAEMLLTRHDPDGRAGWRVAGEPSAVHPEVAGAAHSLLGMAEETRSGIVANAERALRLFGDPRLGSATHWSDFVPSDLMDRERAASLYLTVPGGELVRLGPVLRLFLSQLVQELLRRQAVTDPDKPPFRHRLLLLLDEFPIFGELRFLEQAAGILRGYGVVLLIIVQSVTQLRRIYGPHETVSGMCPVHVTMGASDLETAERISRRLGRRTVETERASVALGGRRGGSVNEGDHGRYLLEADEVARLPQDELLILALGRPPILAKRAFYFEDREWLSRTRSPPPPDSMRFAHDWREWTEHGVELPTQQLVRQLLEERVAAMSAKRGRRF